MSVTYGLGGYDPDHPNGNIVEQTADNGDGTGTRTIYNPDGTVAATEELSGLPVEPDPEPTAEERIAELEAVIAALLGEETP